MQQNEALHGMTYLCVYCGRN